MVTAEQIKGIRAATGLSQRAFAEKLNIPQRTVENWEQGVNSPPDYVIALIYSAVRKDESMGSDMTIADVMRLEKLRDGLIEASKNGYIEFDKASINDLDQIMYDKNRYTAAGGYKIVLDSLIDENHHDAISYYGDPYNRYDIMLCFYEDDGEPYVRIAFEDGTEITIDENGWDIDPLIP